MSENLQMGELQTSIPRLFDAWEEGIQPLMNEVIIIPSDRLDTDHVMIAFLSTNASEASLPGNWYIYPENWDKYVVMCVRDYRKSTNNLLRKNDRRVSDGKLISRSFTTKIDGVFNLPSLSLNRPSTTVRNMHIIEMHDVREVH